MAQLKKVYSLSKIAPHSRAVIKSVPKVKFDGIKKYQIFLIWCIVLFIITFLIDISVMTKSGFRTYLRSLRWTPLPVGIGFSLIAYQQYRHSRKRELYRTNKLDPCECLADKWEIQAYKLLPLRSFSRVFGWCAGVELPEWSRNAIIGSYARTFGCNMNEAEVEDVNKYRCISELFRRKLKSGVRPIHPSANIVSPVDGTVVSAGRIENCSVEQIKGVSYSMKRFFGPNFWKSNGPMIIDSDDEDCYHQSCIYNPEKNDLFHVTVYLAPGDYHRFHSPAQWDISFRRHFTGEMFSVNPAFIAWIQDLFVLNERVSYFGSYKHGFFSMTAVGATNVGSIAVPFDSELSTNSKNISKLKRHSFADKYFETEKIVKRKGEDFGEFNLGSTIVLIFEAPKLSKLSLEIGQTIKLGEPILLDR